MNILKPVFICLHLSSCSHYYVPAIRKYSTINNFCYRLDKDFKYFINGEQTDASTQKWSNDEASLKKRPIDDTTYFKIFNANHLRDCKHNFEVIEVQINNFRYPSSHPFQLALPIITLGFIPAWTSNKMELSVILKNIQTGKVANFSLSTKHIFGIGWAFGILGLVSNDWYIWNEDPYHKSDRNFTHDKFNEEVERRFEISNQQKIFY